MTWRTTGRSATTTLPWNLIGLTGTFGVDGKVVSTQSMEQTLPILLPIDETFDIGSDTGTPIENRDYQVPFRFTGRIDKLTIALDPPILTEDDKKKLMEAFRAAQDAN
jgi:arylsulfatase